MENSYRYFENRQCKYFPCHEGLEDFNCLFCYCPMYHLKECPGNPSYIQRGEEMLKVCTNCTFPHNPDHYDTIIHRLKG